MIDYLPLARTLGFSRSLIFDASHAVPHDSVRDMCRANRCSAYGKTWSCPPGCGTLEECGRQISSFSKGLLVQSIGQTTDEFDMNSIESLQNKHKNRFSTLVRAVRSKEPDCLPLSAGKCTICISCTYPALPCRFPERMFSSMEAYGLLVNEVCTNAGLEYYYGPGKISFTSCIFFNNNQ